MIEKICFAFLLWNFSNQVLTEPFKCSINGYRKSRSTPYGYMECVDGSWNDMDCPGDLIYNEILSLCVNDRSIDYDSVPITQEFLPTEIAELTSTAKHHDYDERFTTDSTVNDLNMTTESIMTTTVFYSENDTETNQDETTVADLTTEAFLPKSIAEHGSNLADQEVVKTRVMVPLISRRKSIKTKANWTTTLLNGIPEYTDISFYQSNGRSYQFRVPGALPAEQNKVISWIRENGNKYPQTDIPYVGDNEYEGSNVLPKELPDRCGTKFLEKLSGGKATPIEDNPWQVAVLRSAGQSYVCGGAVITRRHVLSAAHCFRRRDRLYAPDDILLRVGDYDKEVREESQVDYTVLTLLLHEDYLEGRHLNDIALLTTSEDIPFSSHIYPICLPTPSSVYTPGMICTVSGWGQVEDENVPTRYLRAGQVTIISPEDCRKKTIFAQSVIGLPEIFCAEDPTKTGVDTCLGDSGGPFSCSNNGTFYLYGITAFGSYPCGQDIPSFYTNVSHYRLWILDGIQAIAESV